MTTIVCEGFLNDEKAEELKQTLDIARKYHPKIILDFEKVTYISSVALGVIGSFCSHFDRITIINVNPKVYAVFDITGLTEITNITITLNESPSTPGNSTIL